MKTKATILSAAIGTAALPTSQGAGSTYGDEVAFLKKHTNVIELTDAKGRARLVIGPAYQGRVLTSTAQGPEGFSFGWVNRALIASGKVRPQINAWGGEDRLWVGPEGGPFSVFFSNKAPAQTLEYWQTPAFIDTKAWKVERESSSDVFLSMNERLQNRAGTVLDVRVARTVRMIEPQTAGEKLKVILPKELNLVAYETENTLRNAGSVPWRKETGLLSIWILGMFQHGPRTTVVVPIRSGDEKKLGQAVRSDYFGEIPADRLKVEASVIFYRADGQARGKIGVSRSRAAEVVGSWDAERGVLTLVQFTLPKDVQKLPYVDSRWIDMKDPYAGDVVNSYNDGPPEPGKPPLGPFYELETSSPAAELKPGASLTHFNRTFHLIGSRVNLNIIAQQVLGASLDQIESAFQ